MKMNKIFKYIILIWFLSMSLSAVNAQITNRFYFGIKGGVNFSFPLAQNEFSVFTQITKSSVGHS